ncbi:MAG: MFS transporter [Vulcanimicrobiaceae bacterium]
MSERRGAKRTLSIVASLRFHDFRLLWIGLLVSNLGTWMQFTAMGYYVAQLAVTPHRAALYLGILGASRAVPVLLLSPVAGVLADTVPRRRVLMLANGAMALAALALALLASADRLGLLALVIISAFNSAAQSFDSPTRQSWVPMLVDRQYVGNAIGLNSVAFNAPAVVGPAIAGILIVWVGVAGSFYVNAVATLAVVIAVAMMAPSPSSTARREPMLASINFGLAFLVRHKILRWIIGSFVLTAIFTRPYSQLIPAFIVNTLHGGPQALGWAVAAVGIGGFAGALLTAHYAQFERRSVLWLVAGLVMSAGVLSLAGVRSIPLALPVLFFIGVGTLAYLGACNTMIQVLSPDAVRGRAMSVYTMIAIGVVPGGSLIVGAAASVVGLHLAFLVGGGICVLAILGVWLFAPIVRTV